MMRSNHLFCFRFLCLAICVWPAWACSPSPSSDYQEAIHLSDQIYVQEGEERRVRRYLKALQAHTVSVEERNGEAEEEEEYSSWLLISIANSKKLSPHSLDEQEKICFRMSQFVLKHLAYSSHYDSCQVVFSASGQGDKTEESSQQTFTFLPKELGVSSEEIDFE